MKSGVPFRAAMMFAAALASIGERFKADSAGRQAALAQVGAYEGRGKGRTKFHHGFGNRAYQRKAIKARNVRRFRRAQAGVRR